MIELICPSKGRPDKLKRMWDSARRTADSPNDIYLRVGVNEEEREMYRGAVDGYSAVYAVKDWSTVYTTNLLADKAFKDGASKLFMIIGDDAIFTSYEWDKALREHYDALNNKIHIYSFLDSRSPAGTPHPIATREYIDAMGTLAPPIFLHWYVDTWMVQMAKDNNCFTHLKDYLLVHDKPSDKGMPDETHNSIRERGWHERDSYVNAICQDYFHMQNQRLFQAISCQ